MNDVSHNLDPLGVRERLLNAAEQVVTRDGVSNLTLEAVAREAGVSKGGLLYHFPSKSALVTAIVERLANQCDMKQRGFIGTSGSSSPGAFTRSYLLARVEPLGPEERTVHSALLAAAGTDPQYLDAIRKRFTQWQARLESDGIDPATATIVRLAIDGLCLCNLLGLPVPEGDFRHEIIDKLLTMTVATAPQKKGSDHASRAVYAPQKQNRKERNAK